MKTMCFMKDMFNSTQHCTKYGKICIRSCKKCTGGENEKCSNLKDRAQDCSRRDCRASDRMTRYRAHVKCARTCCQKGQLY